MKDNAITDLSDRTELDLLREGLAALLSSPHVPYALKNLTMEVGKIRYDRDGGSCSIDLKVVVQGRLTPEEKDYDLWHTSVGLPPRGTVINLRIAGRGPTDLRIVGWAASRRKYPVICEVIETGERRLWEVQAVKRGVIVPQD